MVDVNSVGSVGQKTILGSALLVAVLVFFAAAWWRRRLKDRPFSVGRFTAWLLQALADAERHPVDELRNYVITRSNLTEELVTEALPTGLRRLWANTFQDSLNELERLKLAYTAGPDVYVATRDGLQLARHTPRVVNRYTVQLWDIFDIGLEWIVEKILGQIIPGTREVIRPLKIPPTGGVVTVVGPRPLLDPNLLHDPRNVQVWYGTNCRRADPKDIRSGFSPKRDDKVYYGRCIVNIPEGHKKGTIDFDPLEQWTKGKEGIVVKGIQGMTADEFWITLASHLEKSATENSMLLFVHGYTVGFFDAAIRTAQLKYDLKMPHAAFYAWPSKRKFLGYVADVDSADATETFLGAFLNQLGTLTAEKQVKLHVIAHSMGNFAFLNALRHMLFALKGQEPKFKLAEVIFAAADVDADGFRNRTLDTAGTARQRTLYASRKDLALLGSKLLRMFYPRAGRIPPITIAHTTDTVDVSSIDLSLLGHGYVAEAVPVIEDMQIAIHSGTPPDGRPGLTKKPCPAGSYWVMGKPKPLSGRAALSVEP